MKGRATSRKRRGRQEVLSQDSNPLLFFLVLLSVLVCGSDFLVAIFRPHHPFLRRPKRALKRTRRDPSITEAAMAPTKGKKKVAQPKGDVAAVAGQVQPDEGVYEFVEDEEPTANANGLDDTVEVVADLPKEKAKGRGRPAKPAGESSSQAKAKKAAKPKKAAGDAAAVAEPDEGGNDLDEDEESPSANGMNGNSEEVAEVPKAKAKGRGRPQKTGGETSSQAKAKKVAKPKKAAAEDDVDEGGDDVEDEESSPPANGVNGNSEGDVLKGKGRGRPQKTGGDASPHAKKKAKKDEKTTKKPGKPVAETTRTLRSGSSTSTKK